MQTEARHGDVAPTRRCPSPDASETFAARALSIGHTDL
jgi:hypothetical protein